jgi:hypothetical protein
MLRAALALGDLQNFLVTKVPLRASLYSWHLSTSCGLAGVGGLRQLCTPESRKSS